MKQGYLSQYFKAVAAKTLSAVEADSTKSNQHEFNGDATLKKIFGIEKQKFPARFIYLRDFDNEPLIDDGFLTWYDARERHATRSEYRMYFPKTSVSICMTVGDELFIGLKPDNSILAVIAEGESTIANQIQWLFGLTDINQPSFSGREEPESENDRIEFASKLILEQIGIEIDEMDTEYLGEMLRRFDGSFPKTKDFSAYARSTIKDISAFDNPDSVLMCWMEREEILFRTLEKHLIALHLSVHPFKLIGNVNENHNGISGVDVDKFISYALSVINRRKSRVGHALENHIEQIFIDRNIKFNRSKVTEGKSKPDFVFPGILEYHNNAFDVSLLTMLGVKSTCKDRWRQVLSEAGKIQNKHLLTLEAAISENQTNEMRSNNLQLVVPSAIQESYSEQQRKWLINMEDFVKLVQEKQSKTFPV